jgi:hypothetical protein
MLNELLFIVAPLALRAGLRFGKGKKGLFKGGRLTELLIMGKGSSVKRGVFRKDSLLLHGYKVHPRDLSTASPHTRRLRSR